MIIEEKAKELAAVAVLPLHGTAFKPDTIAVLSAAYDKAVEVQTASVREKIAKRIIELASAGELARFRTSSG